jgi:hypothetical protein
MGRETFAFDPRLEEDSRDCRSGLGKIPERAGQEAARELAADGESRTPLGRPLEAERLNARRAYALGGRAFLLRESELRTMADLGTFRVVARADLEKSVYGGDQARMEREICRLKRQGLVTERTLPTSGRKSIRVIGLTDIGRLLLRTTNRLPEKQAIYSGIVKRREAKHDAELYRLFLTEAARIENAGGRPLLVVLDYEIKRNLNRDRARLGHRQGDRKEIERLAAAHGLAVVDGKIPLPDLRIEYQTSDYELRRVDLELATRHYRPQGLAEKAKAGFALRSSREDAPRLRRILDKQGVEGGIIAL